MAAWGCALVVLVMMMRGCAMAQETSDVSFTGEQILSEEPFVKGKSEGEERERTNSTRVHTPESDIAVSATHEAEWVYNASASAYRVQLTSMSDNWIGVGFSGSCKSE